MKATSRMAPPESVKRTSTKLFFSVVTVAVAESARAATKAVVAAGDEAGVAAVEVAVAEDEVGGAGGGCRGRGGAGRRARRRGRRRLLHPKHEGDGGGDERDADDGVLFIHLREK
jgi:hypothetical protein